MSSDKWIETKRKDMKRKIPGLFFAPCSLRFALLPRRSNLENSTDRGSAYGLSI